MSENNNYDKEIEQAITDNENEDADILIGKKPPINLGHEFLDLIETVAISVFIVGFIFTFLFRIAVVQGPSMENTLIDGQKLIMSNLFYKPHNLDIVVIDNQRGHVFENQSEVGEHSGTEKHIVKRVIAVAGQTVDIDFDNSIVYVDGKVVDNSFVKSEWHNNSGAFTYPITIPEGYIYVLGDNRVVSNDSRGSEVGLVPVEDVIGKCIFRIYPFSDFGGLY